MVPTVCLSCILILFSATSQLLHQEVVFELALWLALASRMWQKWQWVNSEPRPMLLLGLLVLNYRQWVFWHRLFRKRRQNKPNLYTPPPRPLAWSALWLEGHGVEKRKTNKILLLHLLEPCACEGVPAVYWEMRNIWPNHLVINSQPLGVWLRPSWMSQPLANCQTYEGHSWIRQPPVKPLAKHRCIVDSNQDQPNLDQISRTNPADPQTSFFKKNIFYWLCYYICPISPPFTPSCTPPPSHIPSL